MENIFKVPKSQWKKWSPLSRAVFNDVYCAMYEAQWMFLHPDAKINIHEHWTTTAWNAAWTAAQAVKDNKVFDNGRK